MEAPGSAESLRPVSRSTPNEPLLGVRGPVVLETTRLGAFRASAVAGVLLAVVNSAAIALLVPRENVGLKLRAMHYWVDAAQHLVFALAIGAVVGSCQHAIAPYLPREARGSARRTGKVMLELLAVGVGVFALLALTLPQDFVEFARRTATRDVPPYFGLGMVGACASGVALILVALTRWWRPALGAMAVFIATLLFSVNHLVLNNDYPGVHFAIAATGVLLIIAGLAPWAIFECWVRPSQVAISGLIALSLPALVIPPTRALLVEQLKNDGSVVAMWLAPRRDRSRSPGRKARLVPGSSYRGDASQPDAALAR